MQSSSSENLQECEDDQAMQSKWLDILLEQQRIQAGVYHEMWEKQRESLESHHASLMRAIEESRNVIRAEIQCFEHKLAQIPKVRVPSKNQSAPSNSKASDWETAFQPPPSSCQVASKPAQEDMSEVEVGFQSTLAGSTGIALKTEVLHKNHESDPVPLHVPEPEIVNVSGQKNSGLQEKVVVVPLLGKHTNMDVEPSGLQRFAGRIKSAKPEPIAETGEGVAPQRSMSTPASKVEKLIVLGQRGKKDEDSLRQQLVRFVNGPFDVIMIFIIFLNACCMLLQTEWQGAQAGHSLGEQETFWDGASTTFGAIDIVFIVIYTLEIIIRISVLRSGFFWDRITGVSYANIFDLFLIVFAYLDFIVLASVGAQNLGVLRFLRMAKVSRALRLVRVLKSFQQLRLLTCAIAASLPAFLWSMAILCVLNVIAGVILTQILHEYVMDENKDPATRRWVNDHYGSGFKATWTMFQVTHSGCWPSYSTPLIEQVHPSFALFWFAYVGAVVFAIIKIITAVFIGETMKAAQSDAVTAVTERMKASTDYINKLKDVFETADTSGDGVLTKDEFREMLTVPTIKHYLSHLEIEVHDAEDLFDLLDDGDECVTLSEFVSGITRMKGQARSADMVSLMYDNKITHEQGKEMLRMLHRLEALWGSEHELS